MPMRFSILTLGDNYENLRSHEQFYHEVLEEAEYAEALGYEGFWVGEHHFQASQRVFPSPQMLLAAISQRTKKLRLGTGVNVLPVNDPIRLAEDTAELDLISHGRVCFGAGRGYQPHEYAGFNVPIESAKARFWECLEIIRRAWTEERFSYRGQFYHYQDIALLPRPVQKPHPPIWVGGESVPALKLVVEFGDGWHIGLLTFAQLRPLHDKLRQLMDQAGRDFTALELTALTDPNRLSPQDIRAYRDLGVRVLYMLPLGRDTQELLGQMRAFAEKVRAAA
ncbi:MAG: LLM class flavin-dependent oxidoreductase [Dehalococcoidia bacterium]|nr:LLM class flavin-dependent oxidoreductase [Dehalococcoidia bacterium]